MKQYQLLLLSCLSYLYISHPIQIPKTPEQEAEEVVNKMENLGEEPGYLIVTSERCMCWYTPIFEVWAESCGQCTGPFSFVPWTDYKNTPEEEWPKLPPNYDEFHIDISLCFRGPNIPYDSYHNAYEAYCFWNDFDHDTDVDMNDIYLFQPVYGSYAAWNGYFAPQPP